MAKPVTGQDLDAEFHEHVERIEEQAHVRQESVQARLAVLENEHSVLNTLKAKLALIRK